MRVSPQPDPSAAAAREKRLIGGLSHDLRAPLNSIIGFTDLLQSQLANSLSEKHRGFLKNISSSARDLLSLIDLVVDVALLEDRDTSTRKQTVGLSEIITRCKQLTRERAERRGITLRTSVDDANDTMLSTDSTKLLWALIQVVDRAVDALGSEGEVRLERSLGAHDRTVAVRIVATSREAVANREEARGVNLNHPGIQEAVQLLRQLDGHLVYDSPEADKNLVFTVTIPTNPGTPREEQAT